MPDNLDLLLNELKLGNDQQAEQAAQHLIAVGASAVPDLARLSSHPNADIRWWSTRTLGGIHHPDVPNLLSARLLDPDNNVKQCAAVGLYQQPNVQAARDLIRLLDSEDRLLARLAGNALIKIGKEAVPDLLNAMEAGKQPARVEAARSLAFIDDQRSIPVLLKIIQEGDSTMVEYWAELGLQRMGVGMSFFSPS